MTRYKSIIRNAMVTLAISGLVFSFGGVLAQSGRNNPQRLDWFGRLGYGLFIHWGIDGQIGTVISHSLVGASDDYVNRYYEELPKTFSPRNFDASEWARLARVAGIKYVVFTAKHHSGFCMFDTETTGLNIMNTPYGKDITKEVVDAFRAQGIAIGLYFSPDDFYFLHKAGIPISRNIGTSAMPENNPALLEYDKRQLHELLTNYGKIDILFLDGMGDNPGQGLTSYAWSIAPDIVITRGAMVTPEISPSTSVILPDSVQAHVWEACFTMGTSWQYKPTNEHYRSGTDLINNLIEVRAENGNMLLNVGPTPDGRIPQEQEDRLREIGTWLFINGESVYNSRPWVVTHNGDIWFTTSADSTAIYAFVTRSPWQWGTEKTLTLPNVGATSKTSVQVLGQNDEVLEYHPDIVPKTSWENTSAGLRITAWRAQRIYNDMKWPNPVVLKITFPAFRKGD